MEGAANRAYYAMFNAEQTVILASNFPVRKDFYESGLYLSIAI